MLSFFPSTMKSMKRTLWFSLGATTITFHLILVFSGLVPNLVSRPIHMALALPWIFINPNHSLRKQSSGLFFLFIGLFCCFWIAIHETELGDQYGSIDGIFQFILSLALIIVILEMARRAIGWPLPVASALALAYGLFGQYVPGEFGYSGLPIHSFLGTLTISEGGVWGQLTSVSVNIVSIFVIFGAVLNSGEAGKGFIRLARLAAGKLNGGAAKVSIIASALFGSISGSASANAASTGSMTIPTMIRLNYPRALAGAVEAVASSGGQIMPPLMGAGAFIMVELTGTPYPEIMKAAFLPAILYFFAVWIGINTFSKRYILKKLPPNELPTVQNTIRSSLSFFIPFLVLLWGIFIQHFSPTYSAALAIMVAFALLFFDSQLSLNWKKAVLRVERACLKSGKQVAIIASIILCASIIIGILGITGLGIKLTSLILSGSGGMLWPALMLTAVACLILGMEVPTTAAYIICISVSGPALIQLGLEPLQAHLFVFWYALLSTITPPVCGPVFITAGIVGENWLNVATRAMILGVGLYLVPIGMAT